MVSQLAMIIILLASYRDMPNDVEAIIITFSLRLNATNMISETTIFPGQVKDTLQVGYIKHNVKCT